MDTKDLIIKYLVENDVDYAEIGKKLVLANPEVFLNIVSGDTHEINVVKYSTVIDALRRNSYVESIKYLRTITGFGLKEAKDVIDLVRSELFDSSPFCQVTDQHLVSVARTLVDTYEYKYRNP